MDLQRHFSEFRPTVKLLLILLVAAIPFAAFAAVRSQADDGPEEEDVPIPAGSPDTPLDFPFGSSTTTTIVDTSSTTLPVTTSRVVTQCSDGIDNDRDGRIDLADSGCSSAADRVEGAPPTTTRRPVPATTSTTTTRVPCTPRTYPLPTIACP
ncbi:MAG: hypothetical protein ACT4OM_11420 [Actinomycetota bacterium]